MKKIIVIVIVVAGLAVTGIAVAVGVHSFGATPKYNSAVEREYESATTSFPIALPSGQSYPQSAPPQPAAGVQYEKGFGASFASFYNKCAWERTALRAHSGGDASALKTALTNLRRWNDLPVSVSRVENSDNAWLDYVLKPAESGAFARMIKDTTASCDFAFYKSAGQ